MTDRGWTISPPSAAVPGTYCLSCASALRMLDWFVRCVDCGAVVENEVEAERYGWRFFPDELGQLQPHCGICTRRAALSLQSPRTIMRGLVNTGHVRSGP